MRSSSASSTFFPIPTTPNLSSLASSSTRVLYLHSSPNHGFISKPFPPSFTLPFLRHTKWPKKKKKVPHRLHPSAAARDASLPFSGDDDSRLKAAQEAVSSILQESGVSGPMSAEIASKSPQYVRMLMDGIRDLDEHSLWSSWRSSKMMSEQTERDGDAFSYEEKAYYIAKEKGDKGMLPYLESIGLSPSSSMHVAWYLSSEGLPTLIDKVNYVKEMFFSGRDDGGLLGSNARRMMMLLAVPNDEDLEQTLSFFEKIEARRGGLNMLGSKDAAFRYLIGSFPRLLLLSLESHLKPLVKHFEDIGVPRGCMREIFLLFPPIFFYDVEATIKPRLSAFEKIGAMDKDFGKMLMKYPWIMSTSIQENYKEILRLFIDEKVPTQSVNHAIKTWPLLLGSSTSKLKLMLQQFRELGIRNKKTGVVISTSPQLLLRMPHDFLLVISFLEDLGFDRDSVARILGRCPEIFASSIDKTLKKKLEYLSSLGVSKVHLPQVIIKYPELFVSDIDRTLRPRMNFLLEAGLSKRDIALMIRRFSPLLGYSINKVFIPKLEFLVNTMGKPVKAVVEYPRYFSYSLDRKIKPRYFVLRGRNVECSLKEMLGKNDEEFAAEFMGVSRILVPPPQL